MQFESVLMTFHDKSDEQIAFEALTEANAKLKEIMNGRSISEKELRELMEKFLEAFWVYKAYDMSVAMNIATNKHSIGCLLASYYGCTIDYDEEQKSYYSNCPAQLLHLDFGFSIRALEKYKCSICRKDVLDCDYLTGDFYDDV